MELDYEQWNIGFTSNGILDDGMEFSTFDMQMV